MGVLRPFRGHVQRRRPLQPEVPHHQLGGGRGAVGGQGEEQARGMLKCAVLLLALYIWGVSFRGGVRVTL